MKLIIYYLSLLIFIALLGGYLISKSNGMDSMSMTEIASISGLLALYVIGMSLAGEWKSEDEREQDHRLVANRLALIAGSAFLSIAIIIQLINHTLDYWLLAALIIINLTKIISLIYLNYRK